MFTAPLVLVGEAWVGYVSEDSEQCLSCPPLGAVAGAGPHAPQLAPPAPLETLLSIPLSVVFQEPCQPFLALFFSPWQTRSLAPHTMQGVVPSAGSHLQGTLERLETARLSLWLCRNTVFFH